MEVTYVFALSPEVIDLLKWTLGGLGTLIAFWIFFK
jgi:hypothetical protein